MTEYNPKDIREFMGAYHQLRDTFGDFSSDSGEINNSLVDLLKSLEKIPVELRDDTITYGIAMLKESAPILDGINHYAEWGAAASLLLPHASKYLAPSRLKRTESDTQPYLTVLRDLIEWIGASNAGDTPTISGAMKDYPYLAKKTLLDGLDAIQTRELDIPEKVRISLCGMIKRTTPFSIEENDKAVISRVLDVLIGYWGPQLETLENLDSILD
ncbi:hypothetical protein HYU22_04150 [Candidatus Woesearchaeota archaeon]|nr:hypothetical protein [Candidatus Woesearchaeota archaeon]